jgi:hypothetical protein
VKLILSALRRAALAAVTAGCLLTAYIMFVNPNGWAILHSEVHHGIVVVTIPSMKGHPRV